MGYHLTMETSSRHRIFISFMSTLSIIYPLTTLLVFAIHCYASSLTFELILNWPIEEPINDGDDVVLFAAQTLGKRHVSACETVDAINHCFGWMLLLSTTFYFVAVVNATFYLVGLDNPKITLLDIIFLLFALVHLTFLCFAADHIRVKVNKLIFICFHFFVDVLPKFVDTGSTCDERTFKVEEQRIVQRITYRGSYNNYIPTSNRRCDSYIN